MQNTNVKDSIKPNRCWLGGQCFVLPFVSDTYWIEDSSGVLDAEAETPEIACVLVEILNKNTNSTK